MCAEISRKKMKYFRLLFMPFIKQNTMRSYNVAVIHRRFPFIVKFCDVELLLELLFLTVTEAPSFHFSLFSLFKLFEV